MHLYFYARGVQHFFDLWKTLMQNHFWQFKRINLKTNKEEICLVQGGLRPSVLGTFEYVFPKASLAEVLAVMGITSRCTGSKENLTNKLKLNVLRKIIGCEKIPDEIYEQAKTISPSIIINGSTRGLSHCIVPGVAIHIIGILKDDVRDMDFPDINENWNQEAL